MKNVPVIKNNDYVLDITGYGYEGEGVGKIDNFTVFVPGALANEKVNVKIVKVNKNFAFGKLLEVIESSSHRSEPVCENYKRCGGCQLQHLKYDAQLDLKRSRVRDCLTRIGKLNLCDDSSDAAQEQCAVLHETLGMTEPYRYRNKVQLPAGNSNGTVVVGFYAPRSHDIIDTEKCLIQHECADEVVRLTKLWIEKFSIPTYDEQQGAGVVRHVMVRRAFRTGEVMVVLVTNGENLPHAKEFVDMIESSVEGVTSIIQNVNDKKTNVIMGEKCITLWGKDTISDYIGQFKFNISPLSFFQVNPVQTEVLYNKTLEYAALTGNEVVFDAYCGTGTISLFLSQNAKKVYGVEIVPQAIENAKVNAAENGVTNVEFMVGEAEKVIPQMIGSGIKADVVVVDPPRKGCEGSLLEAIVDMKPERIVYVSCDPGTLARDLEVLSQSGYEATQVQPVDMFPQTAHVETVVRLTRSKATE